MVLYLPEYTRKKVSYGTEKFLHGIEKEPNVLGYTKRKDDE